MLVKQVSVYVENTTGRLAELTHILAEKGIDFRACNIAETVDFGILRFIVPYPEDAVGSRYRSEIPLLHDNFGQCR